MDIEQLLADAERIAPELVPPANRIAPVLGVVVAHLVKAVGGELVALSDKELGLEPPPPPEPEGAGAAAAAAGAGAGATEPVPSHAVDARLNELQAEMEQLRSQLAAGGEKTAPQA